MPEKPWEQPDIQPSLKEWNTLEISKNTETADRTKVQENIGLTLEHLGAIQNTLIQQKDALWTLPKHIQADPYFSDQAKMLQQKIDSYLTTVGAQSVHTSSPLPKSKEKRGKWVEITQEIGKISLGDMTLKPVIGMNISPERKPNAIVQMGIQEKNSKLTNDIKGEFKEKGKNGQEYIAVKLTDQLKVPINKNQSIGIMWGIDDKQLTTGAQFQQKLDHGNLQISGTMTNTEQWSPNLKAEVGYTNKKNTVTVAWTVEHKNGDTTGGVSAKIRF